jgi:hypothetical protein
MLRKPGFFTEPLMENYRSSGNERKAVLRLLFYKCKSMECKVKGMVKPPRLTPGP